MWKYVVKIPGPKSLVPDLISGNVSVGLHFSTDGDPDFPSQLTTPVVFRKSGCFLESEK